jgi:hypothetical protein
MGVPLTLFRHLGEIRYAILCFLTRSGFTFIHKRRRTDDYLRFSFAACFLLFRARNYGLSSKSSGYIPYAVRHHPVTHASRDLGPFHASLVDAGYSTGRYQRI